MMTYKQDIEYLNSIDRKKLIPKSVSDHMIDVKTVQYLLQYKNPNNARILIREFKEKHKIRNQKGNKGRILASIIAEEYGFKIKDLIITYYQLNNLIAMWEYDYLRQKEKAEKSKLFDFQYQQNYNITSI